MSAGEEKPLTELAWSAMVHERRVLAVGGPVPTQFEQPTYVELAPSASAVYEEDSVELSEDDESHLVRGTE